jgi:outer membrane lipoprotein-sorting protein
MHANQLTRRALTSLLLAASVAVAAGPAAAALPTAEAEIVDRVESYFNGIGTLEASFHQLAPNGGVSTGKLFIDRGRGAMRFDYDPPSKILLVAPGDWRLIFQDGSIQQVNVIPLAETPLGFLLEDQVTLGGAVTVEGVRERGNEIDVALVRTDAPDQGRVVLTFAKEPLRLDRWTVTDAQGLTTVVALDEVRTGMPLDRSLFVWRDPKMFGWPED